MIANFFRMGGASRITLNKKGVPIIVLRVLTLNKPTIVMPAERLTCKMIGNVIRSITEKFMMFVYIEHLSKILQLNLEHKAFSQLSYYSLYKELVIDKTFAFYQENYLEI